MADIKSTLIKELFTPINERLLAAIQITKTGGKKKKFTYLCVSVTLTNPVVHVSKWKKIDKNDQYKKQKDNNLKELKQVNGRSVEGSCADFDLIFDKSVIKASAQTVTQKRSFLENLYKICNRYLSASAQPEFLNIPSSYLFTYPNSDQTKNIMESITQDEDKSSDYHAITKQEESDLDKMMNECDYAIVDADKFVNSLSKELSVLDGDNIHSIMGSESQVNSLMLLLDKALNEVTQMESKLDQYDLMLGGITSQMGQMKNQESFIQITNQNQTKLHKQLDTVVMQLDLSKGAIKALTEGDLSTDSGIEACTDAADALQQAMEVQLPQGLSKLQAVVEQQKLFSSLRQQFSNRLYSFLEQLFNKQGSSQVQMNVTNGEMNLPKHFTYHRNLLPYRHVLLWLKKADKSKHSQLSALYTKSVNKVYANEIREYMLNIKQFVREQAVYERELYGVASSSLKHSDRSASKLLSTSKLSLSKFSLKKIGGSIRNLSGSQLSLGKEKKKSKFASTLSLAGKAPKGLKKIKSGFKSKSNLRASRESIASRISENNEPPNFKRFSTTFRDVLGQLEPICQEEEIFLIKFFNLNVETLDVDLPDDELNENSEASQEIKNFQQNQVTKEIRKENTSWQMMSEIFTGIDGELGHLINFGRELDEHNTLHMLLIIAERVDAARQQSDGSFLTKILGRSLVEVKRNFDSFVENKIRTYREWVLPHGKKCGILPFVHDYENFLELSENIFRDSTRRSNIDKAYKDIMQAVLASIEAVAQQSDKTPSSVVEFQNYHHLKDCLHTFKVQSLEGVRGEVKRKYDHSVAMYVKSMMGAPMKKLSTFFEGVTQLMEQGGVRAEEVGFQLKYSKQELRKAMKECSGKEVKKGLESLYHKIEKHTSENDNQLQQVVWRLMQEEFIRQHQYFQSLISKCYPDSSSKLEFTINDVLEYFSSIAQSKK